MTTIANGGTTKERELTVQVTLSRMLTPGQTLTLFRDSVDMGPMIKVSDFTYTLDVPETGDGDPGALRRYMVQAREGGTLIANSPLYEITFFDPPRSEILEILVPDPVEEAILMEDGDPMLMEDSGNLLPEDAVVA